MGDELMARAVTARGAGGGEWGLLAGVAAVVGASTALWVGGGLASSLSGRGWGSAAFSPVLVLAVARSGTAAYWPGVAPRLVWGLTAALTIAAAAAAGVAAAAGARRRPAADEPLRSLARAPDVAHLTGPSRPPTSAWSSASC
jgi:hypothetical protein